MSGALWIVLAAAAAAVGVAIVVWSLRSRRGAPMRDALSAHGAARCIAAERALTAAADRADSHAIAAAWNRLEGPLLEALPDCPPDLKAPLAWSLERCSQACANRSVAQGMMTVRNGLLGER